MVTLKPSTQILRLLKNLTEINDKMKAKGHSAYDRELAQARYTSRWMRRIAQLPPHPD